MRKPTLAGLSKLNSIHVEVDVDLGELGSRTTYGL
jgi:hypothetical protein